MTQLTLLQQFENWLANYWPAWAAYLVPAIVGILAIVIFVILMVIVFIYVERRLLGRFQARLGPNRLGPEGIFQPFADAVKILAKEDIVPRYCDKVIHWFAPVVQFVPVIMIFAVVPIADRAIFTDLNIGILYVVAISSLSTIGMFMAGWSSNNKYSLVAALRVGAQMVSYELPIVLSVLAVVLAAGSLSMNAIVDAQNTLPLLLLQPLGLIIYFLGTSAEINRAPFDMLEADSEIVAGIHTEYSGMKFALFYLGEYGHALCASAVITTLFLGGWQGPVLWPIAWFLIKMFIVFFALIWTRATLPRMRVDQLTAFAWKFLLPLAALNFLIVAAERVLLPGVLPLALIVVNVVAAVVLIILWSRLFTVRGGRLEA